MERRVKISYIGGGSRNWARVFMNDLTAESGLRGELALYDIDAEAAARNKKIGERLNNLPEAKSKWEYTVYENLEDSLTGADFVVISILPGDFYDMQSDVHAPEQYGIYQSVGDTAGPGGVLRAMRTAPLFEGFAQEIKKHCPNAWVINFTNPMSVCVKALYAAFPEIKAFGCCHEVFNAQNFLCTVYHEVTGLPRPDRHQISTDVYGVNHFTFLTKARYGNTDLFSLIPEFINKHPNGFYVNHSKKHMDVDYFADSGLVKLDFFNRYGALGAAGDRHLAEFVGLWYLEDPEIADKWGFKLTPVAYRIDKGEQQTKEAEALANGAPLELTRSGEEAVQLIKAVSGFGTVVSNVNLPNMGQIQSMPLGAIVETNCVFTSDNVRPVVAEEPNFALRALVGRACSNIEALWEGIKNRDMKDLFAAFMQEPLCAGLSLENGKALFSQMVNNTWRQLEPFYERRNKRRHI